MDFETRDLYLAAFLRANGLNMSCRHDPNAHRFVFSFTDKSAAERLRQDFYNGATVGVNLFVREIQNLKALIHGD